MNRSPDHPLQVAVVDDTQLNLMLMSKLVDRLDHASAKSFDQPTAALAWCLHNEPDLVIVDYMMPGMDGLAFIRALRASRNRDDLPILMVTASHERNVRYEALDCGASDFLTKPIDGREFEARVRNMLKLREAHREYANLVDIHAMPELTPITLEPDGSLAVGAGATR